MKMATFPPYKPVALAGLIPYARNARTHSDAQVAQIAASIREFGFTNPILVDGDQGVIAGHGRLLAARKLGMTEVPTVELSHLTPAQKRAYVLADNKLALNAGWDEDMLRIELGTCSRTGFDLGSDRLQPGRDRLISDRPYRRADRPGRDSGCARAPGEPRWRCLAAGPPPAGLWRQHRCRAVETVLAGVRPHLMVTDPPYGVELRSRLAQPRRPRCTRSGSARCRTTTARTGARPGRCSPATWPMSGTAPCTPRRSPRASRRAASRSARRSSGPRSDWCISRGHYHWQHEPCWYAVRGTGHWAGDRKQTTLWQIAGRGQDTETVHGTQKPVECMRRPIENNSSPGQAVYEPFSGSGTTIIAAEMTGRACHAIELSPAYVDVAVLRWQAFTGKTAMTGTAAPNFAQVAACRTEEVADVDRCPV